MPTRCRAFVGFGKYHDIEVDDEVTAYVNMKMARRVYSSPQQAKPPAPTVSKSLAIAAKSSWKVETSLLAHPRIRQQILQRIQRRLRQPRSLEMRHPHGRQREAHRGITQTGLTPYARAVPLLAPGVEGVKGVELANAMLLSAWTENWVDIPVDSDLFYEKLRKRSKIPIQRKARKTVPCSTYPKRIEGLTQKFEGRFSSKEPTPRGS